MSKYKILLAEDNSIIQEIVSKILVSIIPSDKIEVIRTGDGLHAWERIQKKDIDLIITDWDMPRMTGLELLKTIRESEDFVDSPVIMLTSVSEVKEIDNAFKYHVTDYLLKPVTKEKLSEIISPFLPFALEE